MRILEPVRLLLALAVLATLPPSASAEVSLQLRDGRVTLLAREAPIQQVLGEWARKGHTKIVNLERVAGPLLTLELRNLPEGKALAILLRSAAGYIAAPRAVPMPNGSIYDRILILPSSRAAAAGPAARPVQWTAPPPRLPDPTELANGEGEDPNAQQEEQPADGQPRQPTVFVPPTQQPPVQEPDSDTAAPNNPGILATPGITPATAPGQFTTPAPGVLPPPPATPPQPRQ
jgi:hypothetical protein